MLRKRKKTTAVSCFGLSTLGLAMSMVAVAEQQIYAFVVVDGESLMIDASSEVDSYNVINRGRLTSDGAILERVVALNGTLTIKNESVVMNGVLIGASGSGSIENSTLMGSQDAAGLSVSDRGSTATVFNSSISGPGLGASAERLGELTLINSNVMGTEAVSGSRGLGWGVGVFGGSANIQQGSQITGWENGVFFTHGHTPGEKYPDGMVVIDGSSVKGVNGAAIKVEGYSGVESFANISVQNGSELISGNGNLLEVEKSSTANFTVDHSILNGNLFANDTSTMNVTLQNNAQLTGNIVNGNNLTINSGAQWQMLGDSAVQSMDLNGGVVRFGGERFHTLSLGALSGSGTFAMEIDLDTGEGDLLEVNGQANGDFKLNIQNTGVETVSPDIQPLQVVHTEGGDAQFSLLGGRVDLGAYSYLLEQQGNDWFIVGNGKTISPSTQSALALFNAAPNIWMSELSTLRSRMGEVRSHGQGGGWIRAYGNRFDATTGAGIDYKQRQNGFSFGADAPVPVSEGQLVLGLLGGYSKSDLDISRGTSGEVDSYYVGAYGTWLSDEGYYLDAVLKLNKFHNESKVAMSDASKAKGEYQNTGIGGSVEFGKHIKLADDYFVEPFAQLAGVVVQGDRYTLDNGLEAKNSRTQSVLGKVGSSVGRNITLKDGGVLQPYLKAAVAHEFARSNKVEINDTRFNNDLFGSRAELGAGVSVSLSSRLQVHADLDYMKGDHVEQPWGANVGVRLAF